MPRVNKPTIPRVVPLLIEWGHESNSAIFGDIMLAGRRIGTIDIARDTRKQFEQYCKCRFSPVFQPYEGSSGDQLEKRKTQPVPKKKGRR